MKRPLHARILRIAATCNLISGCYSGVGTELGPDDFGDGTASAGDGDAGESSGSGGGDGWQPPAFDDAPPTSPVPRLTRKQYENTAKLAFGEVSVPLTALPVDAKDGVFTSNGGESFADYSPYVDVAEDAAAEISDGLMDVCAWSDQTGACLEQELVPRLGMLYRGEPSSSDLDELLELYDDVRSETESDDQALRAIVSRAFLDARFLFQLEYGEAAGPTPESVRLSPTELVQRWSYYASDNPPPRSLRELAQSNPGLDEDTREEQVTTLLQSPGAVDKSRAFAAEWLSIPVDATDAPAPPADPPPPDDTPPKDDPPPEDEPPSPPEDECNFTADCVEAHGPQATDCMNSGSDQSVCMCGESPCTSEAPHPHGHSFGTSRRQASVEIDPELQASMRTETRLFIEYILSSDDRPLKELFLANYSFIDARLAEHYGVPAPAEDWALYEFPAEARRRGILTQASFLAQTGEERRDLSWIFRGKIVLERLFCFQFPPPPPGALESEIEDRESAAQCAGCHAIMDPIGQMFDRYDATGHLRADEDDPGGRLLAGSDIDGEYASLADFIEALEGSRAVSHCASRMMFRHALGREPASVDTEDFETLWNTVEDGSFKDAQAALMLSNAFETVYIAPEDQICQ